MNRRSGPCGDRRRRISGAPPRNPYGAAPHGTLGPTTLRRGECRGRSSAGRHRAEPAAARRRRQDSNVPGRRCQPAAAARLHRGNRGGSARVLPAELLVTNGQELLAVLTQALLQQTMARGLFLHVATVAHLLAHCVQFRSQRSALQAEFVAGQGDLGDNRVLCDIFLRLLRRLEPCRQGLRLHGLQRSQQRALQLRSFQFHACRQRCY